MLAHIVAFSIFITGACSSRHKKSNSELFVVVGLIDSAHRSPFLSFDSICIFRNDSLLTKWLPRSDRSDTLLAHRGSAKYCFRYENILGERVQKTVSVGNAQKKNVSLFLDYTDYPKNLHNSWIAKLKDNETINLVFSLQGCFNAGKDSVILRRTGTEYHLLSRNKKYKLNKDDLEYLIKFECELPLLPNRRLCTSSETFTMVRGPLTKEYMDSDCCWSGMQRFFTRFGLEKPK